MALTQGDIAFISFNADEDGWSIVTFVDIDPNTTIYFSDGTAASPTAIGSSESSFVWNTGSQKIAGGTVVRFSAIDSTSRASSIGTFTVVNSSDLGLNTTDETVYAFLGNSATAPTTILTAVSSEANNNSLTTVGLTDGVNAIKLISSTDYGQYTGSRSGQASFVGYKALVNNSANWTIDVGGDGATIVPNTTNLAIASGNPTVNLSLNTNSGTEAGTTQIIVTATASSAVSGNQTVNLGVTGTGITTGDYNLSNNIITIPSGQTTGSIIFSVVDDAVVEGTETATLTISNPSSGITLGTTSQNFAIADNDIAAFPTVNLSLSATAGLEANTTAIIVTATASSAVSGNQTVNLGVTGTGITTGDYNLSNNIITIPSGQTAGSVIFSIVNDAVVEGTETATLTISNPSAGITLGTTSQNFTITDNNIAAFPTVNLSLSATAGLEANTTAIIVTATASSAVSGNQTVNLGVTGTGITTGDYNLSNNIITIPSGQTAGSVIFSVVNDAVVEGTETATLTISNPSAGITLGTTSQNFTITDNNIAAFPTVNLSLSATAGLEANTTAIIVTATASSAVSGNQTVNLGVTGTGITTGDYNLSNNIITIPSGQTAGSVIFSVVNDAVVEGTETATLTISNPSAGITLGTTSQNFAIADNNIAAFPIITVSSNNTQPATTIFGNGGTTTAITVLDNNTISNLVSNAPTILQNSTITSSTGQSTITTNNVENLNPVSDLTNFNNSIVVNSLTGSNLVVGTDASENINGSAGNDYLDGKGNNDALRGGDGNDTILGGLGSDTLSGGKGNDRLIGWGGGSGEIDLLNDNQGADTYVLGDASSVFYASSGNGDYADIANFKARDKIELKGLANNYSLGSVSTVSDNESAVGIFTNNGTELIAVVKDGLRLNTNLATDTGFVFV
ncbi:Murein DD-endopeptidase MepM and murein hydrolase activator NlpD, containing LysM domain [Nostoc flagelliforme CCNUN1]|uniref:Murein DD-endopeptidase MepM and murein hydrolase activator NlpD, containing LysM domain n=1 Tax=Nostoc flagelliforme CCNUN1 TaxID=2038116 RepID=A0A2K8SNZ2_9NOSO|nr:calcium-binding protein [Nostoc flagelliforme]AUB37080.1 Murein DD-endopeptidase MepM and murein hydrolase activator NlpD, containing LysM domain [Nostoc flagelliforme CCNUN1]